MIFEVPIDHFPTNHNSSVKEQYNLSVEDVETLSIGIKCFVQNHLQSVKEFIPQTIENVEGTAGTVNNVTSLKNRA
ncbi:MULTISPECIES: hypothetical protein [Bacillus]|uniref:Uncharacterized protein n=1 Tax=Bacillus cereus TaxID=1396 RepID=A0A9X6B344_BACCE|nr:hypothetical protein [Bacillus cereus]OOR71209.1 hypothetical protein BLX06_32070 [Bacillus cereus]